MNIIKAFNLNPRVLLLVLSFSLVVGCSSSSKKPEVLQPQASSAAKAKPVLSEEEKARYQEGLAAISEKTYAQAEAIFLALSARHVNLAGAYVNLGLIQQAQDNLPTAIKYYQQALAINPNNVSALVQMALVHQSKGEFRDSEGLLKQALAQAPNNAVVNYNLGILYELYLRDYEQAIEHYQRYVNNVDSEDTKTVERWIKMLERK